MYYSYTYKVWYINNQDVPDYEYPYFYCMLTFDLYGQKLCIITGRTIYSFDIFLKIYVTKASKNDRISVQKVNKREKE